MYLDFYGLRDRPFRSTPNPEYLYLTARHREALASLDYGLRERCGFLLLTGEVGTGKTTLLQALLARLPRSTATAIVFSTLFDFDDILKCVLEDLGIPAGDGTSADRMMLLNRFLIERHKKNLDTVIVIDEAQNLSFETLEQVRLLSNFETTTEKLLQIVLVGQPELDAKLERAELRQLRQRIVIRGSLGPLTRAESAQYILHRLGVARGHAARPATRGDYARAREPFTPAAVRAICRYARGVPRVLNLVCDHSMILGYAGRREKIGRGIVRQVIRYLERTEKGSMSGAGWHPITRVLGWFGCRRSLKTA